MVDLWDTMSIQTSCYHIWVKHYLLIPFEKCSLRKKKSSGDKVREMERKKLKITEKMNEMNF